MKTWRDVSWEQSLFKISSTTHILYGIIVDFAVNSIYHLFPFFLVLFVKEKKNRCVTAYATTLQRSNSNPDEAFKFVLSFVANVLQEFFDLFLYHG